MGYGPPWTPQSRDQYLINVKCISTYADPLREAIKEKSGSSNHLHKLVRDHHVGSKLVIGRIKGRLELEHESVEDPGSVGFTVILDPSYVDQIPLGIVVPFEESRQLLEHV